MNHWKPTSLFQHHFEPPIGRLSAQWLPPFAPWPEKSSCDDVWLTGPTRREWGKFHPQYTHVKVDGPSFPTKGPAGWGWSLHILAILRYDISNGHLLFNWLARLVGNETSLNLYMGILGMKLPENSLRPVRAKGSEQQTASRVIHKLSPKPKIF